MKVTVNLSILSINVNRIIKVTKVTFGTYFKIPRRKTNSQKLCHRYLRKGLVLVDRAHSRTFISLYYVQSSPRSLRSGSVRSPQLAGGATEYSSCTAVQANVSRVF